MQTTYYAEYESTDGRPLSSGGHFQFLASSDDEAVSTSKAHQTSATKLLVLHKDGGDGFIEIPTD